MNELFQNTKNKMGDRFLPYQSASNNCQVFIMGVLDGNGLNNSERTHKQYSHDGLQPRVEIDA